MPDLNIERNIRIEARRRGTDLSHQPAARAESTAAGEAVRIGGDPGRADAGRSDGHRSVDVAQDCAALGAPQNFTGQKRTVALHRDIEVVLQHKRDYILNREI